MVIMMWMVMILIQVQYVWVSVPNLTSLPSILNKLTHLQYNTSDCGCYIDGSIKADGSFCTSTDSCPCNGNGVCTCRIGYFGEKCEKCKVGYYYADGNDSDTSASCKGMHNTSYKLHIVVLETSFYHSKTYILF